MPQQKYLDCVCLSYLMICTVRLEKQRNNELNEQKQ